MADWPDLIDQRKSTALICGNCWARTFYAMNTDRFCCLRCGPVVTNSYIYRMVIDG